MSADATVTHHLTELTTNRWLVRENDREGKLMGSIEYHEFFTYNAKGERVVGGFWMAKLSFVGWKNTGWKRVASKDEALASLTDPERKGWETTRRSRGSYR